jgi:hypothetical protein
MSPVLTMVRTVTTDHTLHGVDLRAGDLGAASLTAGVSPMQAPVEAILRVDLLGTARMLDAFVDVTAPGGAGVFIASMAGTMGALDPDLEQRLTTTPTDHLLRLPELSTDAIADPWYGICDLQARQPAPCATRVPSLGRPWSPSQLCLTRCRCHRDGRRRSGWASRRDHAANGGRQRAQARGNPRGSRCGGELPLSRDASFITGTGLLVDGGVVASIGQVGQRA